MEEPDDLEQPEDPLLKEFCRHVVGLCCLDAKCDPEANGDSIAEFDPKAFAISTFVLSVRGMWFLITAGHVFHELDTRLAAGRRIVRSQLVDGFGSKKQLPSIPFTLSETPWSYIYHDGLDYGVIPLRQGFVSLLRAGGVRALGENAWRDIPDSADAYFLLGFPRDAREISVTFDGDVGNVNVALGTPLLPLRAIDDPPTVLKSTAKRFYAKVPITTGNVGGREITLHDIGGMSGGPVFAVKRTGDSKDPYWVIAVQSGWSRKDRVLAACPIQPLAEAITTGMDAQEANAQNRDPGVDQSERDGS